MSEVRTIKGPCFDECSGGFIPRTTERCKCHQFLRSIALTEPIPKLEPETRPNVPPRMM